MDIKRRLDAPNLFYYGSVAVLAGCIGMASSTAKDPVEAAVSQQLAPFEPEDVDVDRRHQAFTFTVQGAAQECSGTYAQLNRIVVVNLGNVSCSQA